MWMQTINRTDVERVWVNVVNSHGATITTHWPVSKFLGVHNAASISTNEVCIPGALSQVVASAAGGFIGLAYEDIANGDVGVVQVYGYHESAFVEKTDGDTTVRPGHPMGPCNLTSVGISSVNANVMGFFGPVVALDTVTAVMLSIAGATQYCNHVFLRCL